MKHRKWLVGAAIVGLVAVGGAGVFKAVAAQGQSDRLEAQGTIEATEVQVAPELAGKVLEIYVREGQSVAKGEPVARLDPTLLQEQVNQAQAAYDATKARVSQAEAGLSLTESQVAGQLAQARSAVASAKANLDNAERTWNRVRQLFEQGAVPAQQRDGAEAAFLVAQAQYQAAQTQLQVAGASSAQVEAKRRELEAAKSQLQQAESALAYARGQASKSELLAPLAGVVLRRHVEPGEFTGPGAPVVTLVDPSETWLTVFIPETDIGLVKVGQKVEVGVDSFPQRTFSGTVSEVASRAEFTPKNIQTKKERVNMVFRVKLRLDNEAGLLKPGMPADAYWQAEGVEGQ